MRDHCVAGVQTCALPISLTLSGGEGRALVNQYLNAGVYKADGSGDTVEFASGSFLVVPGGSTGGVLLVSGANVTMFNGSGKIGRASCRERVWIWGGAVGGKKRRGGGGVGG